MNIRLTAGERARLQEAAKRADEPLSKWARTVLLREANIG
jgi:hypothetical protein